jgi:hypothetical protein
MLKNLIDIMIIIMYGILLSKVELKPYIFFGHSLILFSTTLPPLSIALTEIVGSKHNYNEERGVERKGLSWCIIKKPICYHQILAKSGGGP